MAAYFVIGDVHGKIGMLEQLLQSWDGETFLIFLGDLIDRGENSRAVIEKVKSLVDEGKAICIKGNHEYMFLDWLDNPSQHYEHYRSNGGDTTINSLLGRPLDAKVDACLDAERVKEKVADLVDFLRKMPFQLETEQYIFVHAGLDLTLENWRDTTDYQKVWLREPFHSSPNQTGKTIVFGHTPTFYLLGENIGTTKLWLTEDKKIGLDGGAVYGGVLHGLLLGEDGIEQNYSVSHDGIFI